MNFLDFLPREMFLLFDILILVPDLRLLIREGLLPSGLDKAEKLAVVLLLLSESEKVAFGKHFNPSEDCSCYFHLVNFNQLIMLVVYRNFI